MLWQLRFPISCCGLSFCACHETSLCCLTFSLLLEIKTKTHKSSSKEQKTCYSYNKKLLWGTLSLMDVKPARSACFLPPDSPWPICASRPCRHADFSLCAEIGRKLDTESEIFLCSVLLLQQIHILQFESHTIWLYVCGETFCACSTCLYSVCNLYTSICSVALQYNKLKTWYWNEKYIIKCT